jgi:GNAT superfamily N-acetyltransferase
MKVSIRQANPPDIERLRVIYRLASLSNEGDREALLAHPEVLELSGAAINEGRTRVAVKPGGDIVGFATIAISGAAAELEDLFVEPESMGRGVGRELILDTAARARSIGARRMEVMANPHALGFYEKLGFIRDGDAQTQFGPGVRMHMDVADTLSAP